MGDARLILLVDRPDDLRFLRKTGVRADLCVSKTQPLHELRAQVFDVVGELAHQTRQPWTSVPAGIDISAGASRVTERYMSASGV
jgi:hypothetical protein